MFPGPYSICLFIPDDSDGGTFQTLAWGYDTAEEAFEAIPEVAAADDVAASDCVVLRLIDREEAELFTE